MPPDPVLSRLQSGWRPGERELNGAARIEDWRLCAAAPYVLEGRVGGSILSGVAFACDAEAGWARLADRWLRLGARARGAQAVLANGEVMRSAAFALALPDADAECIGAQARELAWRARRAGLTVPAYLLDLAAERAEDAD